MSNQSFKGLSRGFQTFSSIVDEYRTSKMCCRCDNETENVSYGKVKVNSVLRCKNNE